MSETSKIKIIIVDDQKIFRQILAMSINMTSDLIHVGSYKNGQELVDALQANPEQLPDIAIIDIDMPGMNGVELNTFLQDNFPDIKVIVLSMHSQEKFISKMISAGVAAYLEKDSDQAELFTAIKTVHKHGFYMNDRTLAVLKKDFRHKKNKQGLNPFTHNLSDREIQVLQLICNEFTNTEIADQLHLSARTVDGHRKNLLLKIGCKNTAGLVRFAISNKIIDA